MENKEQVSSTGRRRGARGITALVAAVTVALSGISLAADRLTVSISTGPAGFDPQNNNSALTSGVYINMFEYLIMKDQDGNFVPGLATAWEADSDTAWRVQLREDVLWHDGEPFTADDVKFTFERVAQDPLLVRHAYYSHIEEVEIINDHEVVFHTTRPDPIFPSALSRNGASVIAKHHYEALGVAEASRQPLGTGPYRFVEYRTDDRLLLEAFPDYWGGRPHYDEVLFRVIPESTTAVSELLTGGIDIATGVKQSDLSRLGGSTGTNIATVSGNGVRFLSFNTDEAELTGDPLVREAVEYALDSALLLDILQEGYGVPVRGRVSPGTTGSPLELFDANLYDPEYAVELLAEAGYGPGELTLSLMGNTSYTDMADLVSALLQEVGINSEIQLFEPSVWSTKRDEAPNISFAGASDSSFDYGNSLVDLTCPNGVYLAETKWCNEEFSELVQQANTEFDPEARAALLAEATEFILDERPHVYLFNTVTFYGVRDGVAFTPRADSLIIAAEITAAD